MIIFVLDVKSACLHFVVGQLDHLFLRNRKLMILPWKFKAKVKVNVKVDGHIWGLAFIWYVCFSLANFFHGAHRYKSCQQYYKHLEYCGRIWKDNEQNMTVRKLPIRSDFDLIKTPIPHPYRWAMGCHLFFYWTQMTATYIKNSLLTFSQWTH